MYIPKFKLSSNAVDHIGERFDNAVEITDTTLKKKISDLMGLAVICIMLLPDHQTLCCVYEDNPSLIFEFSEDHTFFLDVVVSEREREDLLSRGICP